MSYTTTSTFTRTSARHIGSKVMGDLRRLRSYYGDPSEDDIENFYEEFVELLVNGYLDSMEYGFKRNNERVVSLKYEVEANGTLSDDHSGGVYARANITGASWFSFLSYSDKWFGLSAADKAAFKAHSPVKRVPADEPNDGSGYWTVDRSYSSDGTGTQRRTFRPAS